MSTCSECGKHLHECKDCPVTLRKPTSWRVAKDLNSYPAKVEEWVKTHRGTRKEKDYCPQCNQLRYVVNNKGSIHIEFGEPFYCGNCGYLLDPGTD